MNDALAQRDAAGQARIELVKALLLLEEMPRLEPDIGALHLDLGKERQGRVAGEQQAVGLPAKLEAANKSPDKKKAAAIDAAAQGPKQIEVQFLEAAKVEPVKNAIVHLTGKLDAMQAQSDQQAPGRRLSGKRTRGWGSSKASLQARRLCLIQVPQTT